MSPVLGSFEVTCSLAAALGDNFELDSLTFVQRAKSSSFNSADVDENVLVARLGLDESKPFLRIKKLYSSYSHFRGLHIR